MSAFLFPRRGFLGVLAAAFWAAPWLAAQAQPLTFERAQALAEQSAPENLARQAQVASAQQAVEPADALPDPKLILGIDNLPIEGPDRYTLNRDSMTMRRIGFMQEVPNSDKRQARRQLAEASVGRAEAEQRAMQLEIKRQTAVSWLDVYYAERSVGLFDQLDRQIEMLRSTVQSLIAGGSAQPGELLQADQEALALQDRRDELNRDVAVARAKLRRWIGNEADQPLQGGVPSLNLVAPHLQQRIASHPELRAASARVGEASAELNEAIAEKTPDWGVEFAYNNRDNMVVVQFNFDLPLFVGTRQGPKINARQQSVSQMEAEQEALLRAHQAELEGGIAELEQLRRTLSRTEKTLIPLASKRADLELAAYQAGNSQLTSVITAQRDLIDAQLRQIEQQRKLSQLSASLYYAYVEGLK